MKRAQLFEFEDQNWFPDSMRIALTKLIVVLLKMIGTDKVLAEKLKIVLKETKENSIVDLGSGAGGVIPFVHKIITEDPAYNSLTTRLTDLYPNSEAIAEINKMNLPGLEYELEPVDARNIGKSPSGLKTMINSFHHMNPKEAKHILASAQSENQSIFIYEMAENKIPLLIWWLLLPISLVIMVIMVIFMTPFVKPLTFRQIFFTYLVPFIPIFYAWDGQASMPRIYSMQDIDELTSDLHSSEYVWEKGPVINQKGKQQGYFILGRPNKY